MQSAPITTQVVTSNPAQAMHTRYVQHYVIKFVSDNRWFSPGTPVSSTNKAGYRWNIDDNGAKLHTPLPPHTDKLKIQIYSLYPFC